MIGGVLGEHFCSVRHRSEHVSGLFSRQLYEWNVVWVKQLIFVISKQSKFTFKVKENLILDVYCGILGTFEAGMHFTKKAPAN